MSIQALLLLLAAIQFFVAAIGVPSGRWNLIAGGLFCWVLTLLIR